MTVRRRTLLALAGSALAGLAGCAGDSGSGSGDETPDGTPTETADATPTETPDESAGGMAAQVDLSTVSYLAGAAPMEGVAYQREENTPQPLSAFPEPFAEAVRQAHDGEFETDEPSEELLAALDEITKPRTGIRWSEPVVRIDGEGYVVQPHLPVLEVHLGDETVEEYDVERTVSHKGEFEDDAVENLVRRIAWNGTPNTARGTYERSLVPEEVEAFLDSYEYAEDEHGVSRIVVERHDWEPPYTIELRAFTDEDRWGREILYAQGLDEDLRQFLETVVDSGARVGTPPYVTDEVPASYFETLAPDSGPRESPLVRLGDTVYDVHVAEGTHGSMPLSLTVESAEPTDDGLARFSLTAEVTEEKPGVEVAGGEPVELHSQIGLPSPLWIAHDGDYHLLYSDRYEVALGRQDDPTSWSLAVDDPEISDISVTEEPSVGDELAATYVVPETVPAGSYTLAGNLAALWQEDPDDYNRTDGVYPFEVELNLAES